MRQPSKRMFPHTVWHYPRVDSTGALGGQAEAYPGPYVAYDADVQSKGGSQLNAVRVADEDSGQTQGVMGHTVYLRATADPGIQVDARLTWKVDLADATKDRKLMALGPARQVASDRAGRGVAWAVDCEERAG